MKFTCDSCGAAYMISDDKLGPGGVKVRCKKCGNVVTVKRVDAPPVVAPSQAPAPAPAGLDDELGSAFDHAFGEPPVEPAAAATSDAPAAPAPAAAPSPAPAATEWYVAIGEAQVGPLPLAEVKKKWEAGEVGPDSLVWRPGMGDWGPLSNVAELATYLAPVPQPMKPAPAPDLSVTAVAGLPRTRGGTPAAGVPAATSLGPDVEWKPAGASAQAAMASEELATRHAAAPAAARPAPARSLMEQMPDSGGVDPTGAIPISIRAMERTDERPVRRSSVAQSAEGVRRRRTVRTVVTVVVLLALLVGGGAWGWLTYGNRLLATLVPTPTPEPARSPRRGEGRGEGTPTGTPTPTPTQTATATQAATPELAPSPRGGEGRVEGTPTAAATPTPPAQAEPAPAKPAAPAKGGAQAKGAAAPPKAAAKPAAVARADAPADKPAAAPGKKKDSVLDFDQGGADDLASALGEDKGGRAVYVPPKTGGAAVAERLSDAQITESVKLHVDSLRRCASEQQARDAGGHGTLKMAWTIQPDGVPRDVRCLTPDLAQGAFAQCITGVVKGIRFPRVGDAKGQPVTFPFGF